MSVSSNPHNFRISVLFLFHSKLSIHVSVLFLFHSKLSIHMSGKNFKMSEKCQGILVGILTELSDERPLVEITQ